MKNRGFLNWLRQMVSSNVFLYKIWFYSIRKWSGDKVRLPSISDDFYFDGYPRSGNTFFAGLLRSMYPNKSFASHLHTISGLKIALKLELPIFVMIRKPKDAVISNIYRKVIKKTSPPDRDLIEMLLISYYNYYCFVTKHITEVNVLKFDSCIKNELLFQHKIAKAIGLEAKSNDFLQETLSDYKMRMKKKEVKKASHASSLPNNNRAEFKKKYLGKVLDSPSYSITEDIYDELTKHDFLSKRQVES